MNVSLFTFHYRESLRPMFSPAHSRLSVRAPGPGQPWIRPTLCGTIAVLLGMSTLAQAALPTPLVNVQFSEGTGLSAANSGSFSGPADFVQANEFPVFSTNVPTGAMTPKGNMAAVDFGTIADGQGGRAIDLASGPDGTMGSFSAFTLTGWLNARTLTAGWGGNRILFALAQTDGPGFDLVQLDNGALRLGINQWPDGANNGGPSSSTGAIVADPQAGPGNWIFFAVTYDSALESGNVKYYFGAPDRLASLDSAHAYKGGTPDNGGLIESSGPLTIGNFGTVAGARTETGPNGGSRVFRGLMDELKVYQQALDLADIQRAQMNGELPPVPVSITRQPVSLTTFAGQPATLRVEASGAAPLTYQWQRNGANIPNATEPSYVLPAVALSDNAADYKVVITNPSGSTSSQSATLTVLAEDGHKVSISFSEGSTGSTNRGNLNGTGKVVQRDGLPLSTSQVPTGSFAPTDNLASLDFGPILDGQGGRAVDFTNSYGNTLGAMTGFTVCGWLNAIDLRAGWGGNRIVFALASGGGPGLDLVQLADGSLQLGVNQWPDGSPATSSLGRITESADAASDNWVFFAVTYDGTLQAGNAKFYFGKGAQAAELDVAADYDRGVIAQTGSLTIGNFSAVDTGARTGTGPTTGSRCFRGLLDEINIFNKTLALEEIQALQKAPAYRPVQTEPIQIATQPQGKMVFAGQAVSFNVVFAGSPPFTIQWQRNGQDISGATESTLTLASASAADTGAQFRAKISNAAGMVTSDPATLTVVTDTGLKLSLSFSESAGTNTANAGDLGGSGVLVQKNGFPVFSDQVPSGAFAPANNRSSVDFGTIESGQGGRAIDFSNPFDDTVGPLTAFTVTGWLNCRDLRAGWGGNRLAFALASPDGPGFDIVQQADGSLRLGVNQWPDGAGGGGPASTAGKVTEDTQTGAANWVFFAVSYDSAEPSSHVRYYFGSPTETAQPDVLADYFDRGPILRSGRLTLGNFGSVAGAREELGPDGGSRVFRGLIDEVKVFSKALSLEEIQVAQKAASAVGAPRLSVTHQANNLVITWPSAATFQLQSADALGLGSWINVSTTPVVKGSETSVSIPLTAGSRFFRLRAP